MRQRMVRVVQQVLAALSTLTFALASVDAGAQVAATPRGAAANLSDSQLQKLAKIAQDRGKEIQAFPQIVAALGIPGSGNPIVTHQLATHDPDDNAVHHFFNVLPTGQGYLFGDVRAGTTRVFWVNNTLDVVAAVSNTSDPPVPVPIPMDAARKAIVGELQFWASIVDLL